MNFIEKTYESIKNFRSKGGQRTVVLISKYIINRERDMKSIFIIKNIISIKEKKSINNLNKELYSIISKGACLFKFDIFEKAIVLYLAQTYSTMQASYFERQGPGFIARHGFVLLANHNPNTF
jgi:hypothetical protein